MKNGKWRVRNGYGNGRTGGIGTGTGAVSRARRLAASAALAVCAALAVLSLSAEPARAQSNTTLVSNIGQAADNPHLTRRVRAQRFTTGPHADGYHLTSVDIVLGSNESGANIDHVSVCETDASGFPTSTCTELDAPTNLAQGTRAFSRPAGMPMELDENRVYTVVVTPNAGFNFVALGTTSQSGEDMGGAMGWSIHDQFDQNDGSSWSEQADDLVIRIRVNGSEQPSANRDPILSNAIPDQTATVDTAFDYAFPPDTFTDADNDMLTYTATKGDDTALPSWLTFTSATRTFSGTPPVSAGGRHTVKVTASDGRGGSASDEFVIVVSVRPNTAPTVNIEIPDRDMQAGDRHTWPIAHYNFTDAEGDPLTFSATKDDDTPLPSWVTFTPATRIFVANVTDAQIGRLTVKVTATDDRGASVSDEFDLVVTARRARTRTGGALKICGRQRWSDGTNAVIWNNMLFLSRSLTNPSRYGYFGGDGWLINDDRGNFPYPPGAYGHTLSQEYVINELVNNASTGAVIVNLDRLLTAEDRAVLSLTVCDTTLAFSDATVNTTGQTYTWSNTGQDWSKLNYAASPAMIGGLAVHGKVRASMQVAWNQRTPRVDTARVSGTSLTLTFDRTLNTSSSPAASVFTVRAAPSIPQYGSASIHIRTVSSVAVSGNTVTLTLAAAPPALGPHRPGLRVSYDPPSTNPLKSNWSGGALVKAFTDVYVTDTTDTANATASDPPQITGAPGLSASQGTDGAWSPGETVEASFTFDEAVVVDTTNGTPSVELRLGGTTAKSAPYVRGSGTTTLVFSYTLTAADGSHTSMLLSADSLALNGGTIRGQESGEDALLTHLAAARAAEPAGMARSSQDSAAEGEAVTVAEDAAYAFKPSDFGFDDDPKRDRNSNVTIKTLPGAGALTVNGGAARKNQTVSKTDIGKGRLVFTPVANAHGAAYASFDFTTYNGRVTSDTATMTIDVTAVNDAPAGAPGIDGEAEAGRTVTATTAGVSDPDGLAAPGWTYRWIRVVDGAETAIAGETGSSYVLATADVGHKIKVEVSFTDDGGTEETAKSAAWPSVGSIAAALTATFGNAPATHDGEREFTVSLRFSAEPQGLAFATVKGSLLETTNATILGARRLTPGSNLAWEIRARPGGTGAVRLRLPVRACTAANAICVDGRALGAAASVEIAYAAPQVTQTPLTAGFTGVPAGHNGGAFTIELALSEDVRRLGYATVAGALAATGGRVDGVRRLVHGRNRRWEVRVSPSGLGAVRVTLGATNDCASSGAICTPEGKMLSTSASATVPGPALAVADATVEEGAGAELAFTVTLSRAAAQTVTVQYATSDGTATAGADYTSASGTLTFAAGDTSKTVRVAVADDAHDEASETMTLTLSNPVPASVALADATATGTITNTDAMPGAWLARFGREAAGHVADAIAGRLRGEPRTRLVFGGQELAFGRAGFSAIEPGGPDTDSRLAAAGSLRHEAGAFGRAQEERTGEDADNKPWRELSMPELLLASSFHLASAEVAGAGAGWALWGRAARSSFEGAENDLALSGDVTTATLGVDHERGRWLVGVALARSAGEGSYRADGACGAGCSGEVESALTGLYPYARYRVSGKFSVWGAVGYGEGDLTLTPEGARAIETGVEMRMAAGGARGVLLPARAPGGFELALRADLLATSTGSDAAAGLAKTDTETSRLRLMLEASRSLALGEGVLTPSVEIGMRNDGGDAETGSGLEMGAALRYDSGGLTVEVGARGLLAHSDSDYEEWGVSGSVRYAPGADGRGLSLRLGSAWGADSGGAERLWAQAQSGLGGRRFDPAARLDAEVGYGLAAPRGLLTPYAGASMSSHADTWRAGARWKPGPAFDVSLEATLTETDGAGRPESGVLLRGARRW